MDEPAFHLDIDELRDGRTGWLTPSALRDRLWIGIRFDCCGAYTRIYRNAEGTAYRGACPRCLRSVCLRVGPGGTDARFFLAE